MTLPVADETFADAQPELVHWMEPKPMTMGAGGISATAAGAFFAGALAAVGVLALLHMLGPDRRLAPPWRWSDAT